MRKPSDSSRKVILVDETLEDAGHTKPSGPPAQSIFYSIDTLYSITLNPCDTHQYILKSDRKTKIKTLYREILEVCNCKYHLKLEFSEPRGMRTKDFFGPRLHFHGVIKFCNREQLHDFLFKVFYMLCKVGTVDIDSCPTPQDWYEYMYKQKIIKDKISNFDFLPNDPEDQESSVEDPQSHLLDP